MKPRFRLAPVALLASVCFAVQPADAQEATTGTIEGTVADASGAPLPGVAVTITSAQGDKTETTDANGRFLFPYLPVGEYGLRAVLQGFNTAERQNLRVTLGSRVRTEVTMTQGVTETVDVIGEAPVVDLSTTTTGATISSELLQSVPVGRNFANTLALAPGVVGSGIDAANPSISGASGLENTYVVDGVNVTNTGYGSAGSYSIVFGSLGSGVNFGYIKEIQIKTGGYEPEYGEALGGFVNLVTKTGGNDFRSNLFGYHQDDAFEGDRASSDRENATFDQTGYRSTDFGFEASGPLARDKAFFFGAFNPTYTTAMRRTSIATRQALGFDHEVEVDREIYNYAGNVKWFLHPKHTVTVSAFGDPSKGPEGPQRESSVSVEDPELRSSEIEYGGHNGTARWEAELIPSTFLEASYGYHEDTFEEDPSINVPQGVDRRPIVDPATGDTLSFVPRQYGGVGFFDNAKSTNHQYRLKLSTFLHGMGEHNVRYGAEFQDIGYRHTANYSGLPGITLSDGSVSTSGFTWDINADGERFRINRIRSGDLSADTTNEYLAFFLSDSWSPVKWVNLMGGVRYEQNKLVGTVEDITWDDNWAPRAHLTIDPTRDGKSKISFAYGRFFGKVPNDLAVRALSTEITHLEGYPLSSVDLTDPNNPKIIGPPLPDDVFSPLVFGDHPTRIDPDSKLTYQDEYVASLEREVLPFVNVGVSYMHRRLGRTLEDVALVPYTALVNGADFGEYFITNPTPALGFPEPSRKYNAVTFKMEKRFTETARWQALGSYTWSRLKGNYEGYYRRDNGQSDPYITSLFDFPYLATPADREIFRYMIDDGLLPNDRTHVANLFGSYLLPMGLNLGGSVRVQSGVPLTKLGYNEAYGSEGEIALEERGASGRTPTSTLLGLHADYMFNVRGEAKLGLVVDVFNLLNQQKGVNFDQEFELGGTINPHPELVELEPCTGCESPDFGKPTTYEEPRTFRVALRASY